MTIKSGEAVRVFTGSPMPKGSNHVLIQEHATVEQDQITVSTEQSIARHIRKAGGDFCKGDIVLKAEDTIGPSQIGLAAAANYNQLPVYRRLKVAILTTGSELQSPCGALEPGQIVDSNSYAIGSLSEALGADVERLGIAADSQIGIEAKFEEASAADIIVTIGGASVGKHDLVRGAFEKLEGEYVFERIAVRPGKPSWFGKIGDQVVLGLPGNPTAAYVMASLLLKPLFHHNDAIEFLEAMLAAPLDANGPRETFTRAKTIHADGSRRVLAAPDQDTSRVQVLASSNCLIHRPENDPGKAIGDIVNIVDLA